MSPSVRELTRLTPLADRRLCQFASRGPLRQCGAVPLLDRYPAFHTPAALPRSQDHGERHLLALGQAFDEGQVGEEHVPYGRRRGLFRSCMGWRE